MVVLERFEGDIAVLETDSGMQDISRKELPLEVKEGDVLVLTSRGYCVDNNATQARRAKLLARIRKLKKK
ncbi:MAG: DUF3006 domain-containing protein [Ruminococcus sp.]|nr:DUF3006 domain-containing protein [Ruminococcus sp.]